MSSLRADASSSANAAATAATPTGGVAGVNAASEVVAVAAGMVVGMML